MKIHHIYIMPSKRKVNISDTNAKEKGVDLSISRIKTVLDTIYLNKAYSDAIQQIRGIIDFKTPQLPKVAKPPEKKEVKVDEKKKEPKNKKDSKDEEKKEKEKREKREKSLKERKEKREREQKEKREMYKSLAELPAETQNIIRDAHKSFEENEKYKFSIKKIKSMNAELRTKYKKAKREAKREFEKSRKTDYKYDNSEVFDDFAFNEVFDHKFYTDFVAKMPKVGDPVRIAKKSKPESKNKKKTEESVAIELISKLKIRLSPMTKLIFAAFAEFVVRQMIINGMFNCINDGKKIIKIAHVMGPSREHGYFLDSLITSSNAYKEYMTDQKNYGKDDDESDDGIHFKLYVGNIFRTIRNEVLGNELKFDHTDEQKQNYIRTNISKQLRVLGSNIILELLGRISAIIETETLMRKVKTITPKIAISMIRNISHTCGVKFDIVYKQIHKVILLHDKYVSEKVSKKAAIESKKEKQDEQKAPAAMPAGSESLPKAEVPKAHQNGKAESVKLENGHSADSVTKVGR